MTTPSRPPLAEALDLLRHPTLNHRPVVQAEVRAEECSALLTDFFKNKRL
jgi:tRNA(Arg) A34 adenosine deaminase TadA